MEGEIQLKRSNEEEFDIGLCIIYQGKSKEHLTSTENGRSKIMASASRRRDNVWTRLQLLDVDQHFQYHVDNRCYKAYTHEKNIKKFEVS